MNEISYKCPKCGRVVSLSLSELPDILRKDQMICPLCHQSFYNILGGNEIAINRLQHLDISYIAITIIRCLYLIVLIGASIFMLHLLITTPAVTSVLLAILFCGMTAFTIWGFVMNIKEKRQKIRECYAESLDRLSNAEYRRLLESLGITIPQTISAQLNTKGSTVSVEGKKQNHSSDNFDVSYSEKDKKSVVSEDAIQTNTTTSEEPIVEERRKYNYCPFCGMKIPPEARFCPSCGREL